jgi:hypothetical protein
VPRISSPKMIQVPALFARVRVDSQLGTLIWPGGLDIAPEPLYHEAKRRTVHTPAA